MCQKIAQYKEKLSNKPLKSDPFKFLKLGLVTCVKQIMPKPLKKYPNLPSFGNTLPTNFHETIITFIKKSEYIYVKPSRSCLVTSLRCRVAKINVWVLLYYQKDYRKSVTYFYCISLILKMKIMPSPLCFLKRALAQFNAVYGVVPTNKNGVCTSY